MSYQHILYEVAGHVATVTFNNPAKLNAWSYAMNAEIRSAMEAAADDHDVRVIILTGAGRGFCAGADMAAVQANVGAGPSANSEADVEAIDDLVYFTRIPKPIIAAVNGPAAGIGAAMAIFSDYRFIAENAKFTTTFARRGLIAEFGIAWMLARQIGIMNALDVLSARVFTGAELANLGLARALPAEGFMEGVRAFAHDLAFNVSPRSMGVIKRQLYESFAQSAEEARQLARIEAMKSFAAEDYKEGVAHFLEKRAPAFTGR
ncbi:MAG: enoyl-CoA hydratase-related protein [Hyphomonadaceae bacterium]